MLGSVRLVRRATLACVALSLELACGKVEEPPDGDSASGGTAAASGGVSTVPTGGQSSAAGGSPGLIIDPTVDPDPPRPDACDDPELDPPCNENDLHGARYTCLHASVISFTLPLSGVTPPAEELRVVCLPHEPTLGAGGLGGSGGYLESSIQLELDSLLPGAAGSIVDGSISLTQKAESVDVKFNVHDVPDESRADYVESHPQDDGGWYGVIRIALVQGSMVVSERRVLVDDNIACAL